ncbi:hypothetical protein BC830DRAFT_813232 [Chytriomyces sp. MP71]|nr:hypothetical protein BC830DRAFT_813232 [Chytriomyces sp. MP71]
MFQPAPQPYVIPSLITSSEPLFPMVGSSIAWSKDRLVYPSAPTPSPSSATSLRPSISQQYPNHHTPPSTPRIHTRIPTPQPSRRSSVNKPLQNAATSAPSRATSPAPYEVRCVLPPSRVQATVSTVDSDAASAHLIYMMREQQCAMQRQLCALVEHNRSLTAQLAKLVAVVEASSAAVGRLKRGFDGGEDMVGSVGDGLGKRVRLNEEEELTRWLFQ